MIPKNIAYYRIAFIAFVLILFGNFIGCLNKDQQQINELLELGIKNAEKGNFNEGLQHFNKVLEIDPENYLAYYNRGLAYKNINEYKNAIADLNYCIKLDPSDSWPYFQIGGVWCDQGDLEKGISFYSKAIEVDPKHIEPYGTRGIIKSMLGRIDSALDDLNTAIEIDPKHPMLYIVRAQIIELKGDCQAAIEDYEKAMSFDPEKFNTKGDIAWILAACPDRNIRDGEKALKIALEFPDSDHKHDTFRTMAAAYADIGDFENALSYQEKAVQELKNMEYENELSRLYYEDKCKKCIEQLESYKKNTPWYLKKF
ncbi:MAG: tetratricopeptide repeat protein [Desulfatiglans sp.]|jgi:tetratricopeptide (TPR) repeat protein|nr:tetratricopeptide repeat protein [Thermodesulfobacteriota bacterium]MEE4353067.1 tetratricopeptide repeat protein [Desulfatiglans sp.]